MCASLSRTQPLPRHYDVHNWGLRVARQPPGALAERSGSERIAGRAAAARPGRQARLEDVQKVLTGTDSSRGGGQVCGLEALLTNYDQCPFTPARGS